MKPSFYRRLAKIAGECNMPRYQVLKQGIELVYQKFKKEHSPLSSIVGDEKAVEHHRKSMSKISRSYWNSLTEEEKKAKGKRAAQARWEKAKQSTSPRR